MMRKSVPSDLHIDDARQLSRRLETKAEAYEKIMGSEILTLLGMDLLARPSEVAKHEAPYLKPSVNWLSRGLAEAREWLGCISEGFGAWKRQALLEAQYLSFCGSLRTPQKRGRLSALFRSLTHPAASSPDLMRRAFAASRDRPLP
jgi:hypothetical protein